MTTFNKLTHQERRVLVMVAQGFSNAKIATELVISPRTVETHLYHIFDKLGVSTRTQAAIYALQTDLTLNSEIGRASHESNNQLNYS
jgi:DNA-binding NarL/FixJ family response regulator